MIRKLKTVGLAFAMVAAVSAAAATTAPASSFTADSYSATIVGVQSGEHWFIVEDSLKAQCKKSAFHGVLSSSSSTLVVTPSYSECTAFGIPATVNFNGCQYRFHLGSTEVGNDNYAGTLDLFCPEGVTPEINAGFGQCVVHLESQLGLGPVFFENDTAAGDIYFSSVIANSLKYTKTKDGFGCPLTGTGAKSDGAYFAVSTLGAISTDISASD